MEVIFNVFLSATVISVVLWVSKSNPSIGGFIISLPLSTLIILAFSKIQNPETQASSDLAKSIFVGVPSTLVFFIPFLLADKLKLSFWTCYISGILLLSVGFFIHRYLIGFLIK